MACNATPLKYHGDIKAQQATVERYKLPLWRVGFSPVCDVVLYIMPILTLRTQSAMLFGERRMMMVKHISSRDARAQFADLLGSVYYTNEAVIVEKKGKPVAVIVSPAEYQAMQEAAARDWAVIDQLQVRNADRSADEVLADVTAEVEAVRHTRHGE
ncbi:MAG: type II toxin-antitoxin system Phd/YefM family antitoxin [Thermomicrobiales bacterium]